MKKYKVNVNGTEYEVSVEEIKGGAPTAAPAKKENTAPVSGGSGETVKSPMPGNILAVNVAAGDTVKSGQVLMILEAMKMENEIMAPCDGKVTSVAVAKGSTVESGSVLCTIA